MAAAAGHLIGLVVVREGTDARHRVQDVQWDGDRARWMLLVVNCVTSELAAWPVGGTISNYGTDCGTPPVVTVIP